MIDETGTEKDAEAIRLERNTALLLATILLGSLVSIAFFNLDRHSPFPAPSQKLLTDLAVMETPFIFAYDPVALATLEEHRHDIKPKVFPLRNWPPEGPVLVSGSPRRGLIDANLERHHDEGSWSVWLPGDFVPLPFFGLASVEIQGPNGRTLPCPRDLQGAHRCGDSGWTHMRMRPTTVDGERETCIWAHPLEDMILRFRFPNVSGIGPDGQRLWLESGLRDVSVGTGAPVDFRIRLGDEVITHRHRDQRGWQAVELPGVETPSELIVEISADRPGRRHLCYRFDFR